MGETRVSGRLPEQMWAFSNSQRRDVRSPLVREVVPFLSDAQVFSQDPVRWSNPAASRRPRRRKLSRTHHVDDPARFLIPCQSMTSFVPGCTDNFHSNLRLKQSVPKRA